MNLDLNIVKTYDDMLYDSRPVSFSEFISDKYNNVHNELYNDALNKYFNDFIDNIITSRFIYEYYLSMRNVSDTFDDFYNYIESLNNSSYIKVMLSKLGGDNKNFLNLIFNLTCEYLNIVKEYIINKDIIKGIKSIDNIKDFRILYVNDITLISAENEYEDPYGNIFDSYLINKDSEINSYRIIEQKAFSSELNDYIFILEQEDGTRIGFNKDGEWILVLDENNSYKTVDDILYELNNDLIDPNLKEQLINLTIDEINKYLKLNKNDIIEYVNEESINLINLIKNLALVEFKSYHKIIEIKNSEYWMPSTIYVISSVRPFTKEIVNLDKYWNMNQSMQDITVYDIKNTNENISDSELYEINYINGQAKIRSRSADIEYTAPFKYLDGNINVSEEMTLNNTFTSNYNKYL